MLKKLKSIETIKNNYIDKNFIVKETDSGRISFFDKNNNFCGVIIKVMYNLFDDYIEVEKINRFNVVSINGFDDSIEENYDYFRYKENSKTYKWYFKNEWFEFDDILPNDLFEI